MHLVLLCRENLFGHLKNSRSDLSYLKEMKALGHEYLLQKWEFDEIHEKSIFFQPQLKKLRMLDQREREKICEAIRFEVNSAPLLQNSTKERIEEHYSDSPIPKKKRKTIIEHFLDE